MYAEFESLLGMFGSTCERTKQPMATTGPYLTTLNSIIVKCNELGLQACTPKRPSYSGTEIIDIFIGFGQTDFIPLKHTTKQSKDAAPLQNRMMWHDNPRRELAKRAAVHGL